MPRGQVERLIVRTRMCSATLSDAVSTRSKDEHVCREHAYEASRRHRSARPRPPPPTARGGTARPTTYYAEHGAFLGDTDFVWGPERLREEELACSATSTARTSSRSAPAPASARAVARRHGATVVATDLSAGMVATRVAVDASLDGPPRRLRPRPVRPVRRPWRSPSPTRPSTSSSRRTASCRSSRDSDAVMRGGRPGAAARGRFVFSTTHPVRWAFPDDPGPDGLDRHASRTSTAPRTSSRTTPGGRRTSSTTARSGTGCARSRPPGWCSSTSSNRSGPRGNERALGRLVAAARARSPGRRSSSAASPAERSATRKRQEATNRSRFVASPSNGGQRKRRAQQHRATREAEDACGSSRATGVRRALSVDTRELVGVRRRTGRTLGGAVGHALGLGAPGTDLDEGVLLAVVRRRRLAGLDELLRPLVGQALGPVLELRRARGGVRQTRGQLAGAVGRVGEAVGQLTGAVLRAWPHRHRAALHRPPACRFRHRAGRRRSPGHWTRSRAWRHLPRGPWPRVATCDVPP